jgi:hypothetical protein
MAFITLPYPTFSPNTTIASAQTNANNAAILAQVNGALDHTNLSAAAGITLSQLSLSSGGAAFNKTTTGGQTWGSGLTTDTKPQIVMTSDKGLEFGPGGSTNPDVLLIRSASHTLQLNIPGGGAGTFDFNGGPLINAASIALLNTNSATITPASMGGARAITLADPGGTAKLFCGGASPTTNGAVYFDGSLFQTTAAGTAGYLLQSNGAGSAPTYLRVTTGTATFATAQSKVVTDATVTANTVVVILVKAGTALAEEFSYGLSAGVSFTIYSTNASSTATVGYLTIG